VAQVATAITFSRLHTTWKNYIHQHISDNSHWFC